MELQPGTDFLIERHIGSDSRFTPVFGTAGERYYDFYDPMTGEWRRALFPYEALRLKNGLDAAAGRL
jgi:hypothetical protein